MSETCNPLRWTHLKSERGEEIYYIEFPSFTIVRKIRWHKKNDYIEQEPPGLYAHYRIPTYTSLSKLPSWRWHTIFLLKSEINPYTLQNITRKNVRDLISLDISPEEMILFNEIKIDHIRAMNYHALCLEDLLKM